jgi:ubiquinone/menaquinone biosynthesis C-methylase UbiE
MDHTREYFDQIADKWAKPFGHLRQHPLGVVDGEADAVLANMVLHHAPDPPAAIKEMSRALKPGGTLVITDADTHTHEWLRIEMHDRWLGFDRDTVAGWFRAAGLDEVAVADTHEICSPTSNAGTKAAITIFLAKGRKPTQGPA